MGKPNKRTGSPFACLSDRHKRLLSLYLERGPCWYDKEKAAIAAGYSSRTAKEQVARIFQREDVKAALTDAEEAIRSSALIDEKEYMELLCEMAREVACKDRVSAIKLLAQAQGWDKPQGDAIEKAIPLLFGCDMSDEAPLKAVVKPEKAPDGDENA